VHQVGFSLLDYIEMHGQENITFEWTAFIAIWPAGRSKNYMVSSLTMTPRASKRVGVAN